MIYNIIKLYKLGTESANNCYYTYRVGLVSRLLKGVPISICAGGANATEAEAKGLDDKATRQL